MAEIISLVVAAPALVDLAKYCGKLAIELYNYSEERQIAKFEIANYANQVTCSSTTIRTSHATLERYHQRFPESMVLQDLATEGAIKATEDMSKSILDRLVSVTDDLIDQNDTPISAIKYIKWRFRKKGVLEVILQLDRVQQNIQLIVNMLSIEACELEIKGFATMLERQLKREADIKIKALKKHIREQQVVIEDQLKTISRLEKQARRYGVDQQVSGGLKALHRLGNLIIIGGVDSLRTDRWSRQRYSSWSSFSSVSDSSTSSSRRSSTSSFGPRIRPRRPGGPGDSGGPIARSGPLENVSPSSSDLSQCPASSTDPLRPPTWDQLESSTFKHTSVNQQPTSSMQLADGTESDSSALSSRRSILASDERQRREREDLWRKQVAWRERLAREAHERLTPEERELEHRSVVERMQQGREQAERAREERSQAFNEYCEYKRKKREREEEEERRKSRLEEQEREDLVREIRERRDRKPAGTDRELLYSR